MGDVLVYIQSSKRVLVSSAWAMIESVWNILSGM